MKYRPLGHTDIEVSVLCLGTMTFGEQNSEADAHSQLDRALDAGVNFIDTAEIYPVPPRGETQGLTETHIGTWLHSRRCRDRVILATKVAGPGDWLPYLRDGRCRLDRAVAAQPQNRDFAQSIEKPLAGTLPKRSRNTLP